MLKITSQHTIGSKLTSENLNCDIPDNVYLVLVMQKFLRNQQ